GIKVIPVLVGGARMPSPQQIPDGLQGFAQFQAFELSDTRWDYDLAKLIAVIRPVVDPRFRRRQIGLGAVALATVILGALLTSHLLHRWRLNQALGFAKAGDFDKALTMLDRLQDKQAPDPNIYLQEADIYRMKGDAFHQNEAAENAVRRAPEGDNLMIGRAKVLACDAKFKLNLDGAIEDCNQARGSAAKAHDAEGEVRAINLTANIWKKNSKPDCALRTYQEALTLAQKNGLLLDEYGALTNMGMILSDREDSGHQRQGLIDFENARKGFEGLGELGEAANVYNTLGAINLDHGKIDEARDNFQASLDLAIKGKDQRREATARLNLGLILEQTGSLDAAESQLVKTLDIYERLGGNKETSDVAFVKNALGDIYLQQARYDEARKAYSEAERIRKDTTELGAAALSAASLVNLDLQRGESSADDLQKRIDNAIEQANKAGDSYSEAFSHIIKAQLLLPHNKAEARKEANEALNLAGDNQSDNAVSAQIVLAEIEAANGNTSKALTELDRLADVTYRQENVGQNIEVKLTSARLKKQSGSTKQKNEAPGLLAAIQQEAQEKNYLLLASRAKAILAGNT
ncbi:MAG: tetratricopeptide repeat protein, partial [Silvibacterium sp.]|nr:tetratricopeptide repeat protein [Silvibacterium sp.]